MKLNFKGAYPNYQVLRVIENYPGTHQVIPIGEIKPTIERILLSPECRPSLSLCYFSNYYPWHSLPIDERIQLSDFFNACHNTNQTILEFID